MNTPLCCLVNQHWACSGCDWISCWPCSVCDSQKAPWDIHNEASPICYVAKIPRNRVGSTKDESIYIMRDIELMFD